MNGWTSDGAGTVGDDLRHLVLLADPPLRGKGGCLPRRKVKDFLKTPAYPLASARWTIYNYNMPEATKTKKCYRCKEVKGLDEFGKLSSAKDGKNYYCKPCVRARNNRPEMVEYRRMYYTGKNLEPESLKRVMEGDRDHCWICNTEISGKNKHLDHNHTTLVARGWLCHSCNVAIGLLKEDPVLFKKALEYLLQSAS